MKHGMHPFLFTFLFIIGCSRREAPPRPAKNSPGATAPQLHLHLDGWRKPQALPGMEMPAPACRIHKGKGILRRPARTPRERMESVPCPGEARLRDPRGKNMRTVRISECSPRGLRVDPGPDAFTPGPAGTLSQTTPEWLAPGQVRTWLWREDAQWWAASVGLLHVDATRCVWHREGPVRGALFGPADRVALRDGQIGIHMQADFLLGSLRALFAVLRTSPESLVQAFVSETADLEEALAMAPGSWANPLRERFTDEIRDFLQDRAAVGIPVFLSGSAAVFPVVRRVDPSVFQTGADRIRMEGNSVFLSWVRPDKQARQKLENSLTSAGLGPQTGVFLQPAPDGWRVELPPGWKAASCPNGAVCRPVNEEGVRASSTRFEPWCLAWPGQ